MYKTVRHGDASLQYTILPQIDQFYVNEVSLTPVNPSESTVKDKNCKTCHPFDLTSLESSYLAFRVILLFACCGIGIFLFEQIGTEFYQPPAPNEILVTENIVQTSQEFLESLETESSDFSKNYSKDHFTPEINASGSTTYQDESTNFQFANDEITSEVNDEFSSLSSSTETPISTSTNEETSTNHEETLSETTTAISEKFVNILQKLNILKMPRVSLKLGTNDTAPEIYVKSGVASYKKGKITTSVFHGLSLEGLIFKTPEGTIKPWREKWPFGENSDIFEDKAIFRRDLFLGILIILMVLSVLMALFTALRKHRHSVEAIDTGIPDESSSNLLDVQCRDPVDKE